MLTPEELIQDLKHKIDRLYDDLNKCEKQYHDRNLSESEYTAAEAQRNQRFKRILISCLDDLAEI